MKIFSGFTIVVLCMLTLYANKVSAQQKNTNYYLWANATHNNIGGDFNGTGTYEASGYTVVIPKFKPSVGWEIVGAISKGKHRLNAAIGYTRFSDVSFENDGSLRWIEKITDAYLGYYELNYAYRLINLKQLYLYGMVGVGLNTKSANEAVEASFATGITKYETPHISLGLNSQYFVTKRLFVNASVLYKICNHSSVEITSATKEQYDIEALNGSWLSINLGLGFKFGKTEP